MTSRLYSLLLTVAGFFATLTFGFAVPIACRPFYYLQISLLKLPETTGYRAETIRVAYDELMDYLLKGEPFSTGALAWSPSGKAHFEDCLALFHLDFAVLAVSLAVIVLLLLLNRLGRIRIHRFCGQSPFFYTGIFNIPDHKHSFYRTKRQEPETAGCRPALVNTFPMVFFHAGSVIFPGDFHIRLGNVQDMVSDSFEVCQHLGIEDTGFLGAQTVFHAFQMAAAVALRHIVHLLFPGGDL